MIIRIEGSTTARGMTESAVQIIRDEMKRQKLTPTKMAEDLSIGMPYIYRVLNGEQTPTIEWVEKVLTYLGVEMEWKFTRKKA